MEIYADMEAQDPLSGKIGSPYSGSKLGQLEQSAQTPLGQSTQAPLVKDDIVKIIREYNKTSGFTDRKLTDSPTDALAVVNRRYVTLNGATGSRPPSPVTGQFYFDTSLGKPIWWSGANWVLATGITA